MTVRITAVAEVLVVATSTALFLRNRPASPGEVAPADNSVVSGCRAEAFQSLKVGGIRVPKLDLVLSTGRALARSLA